MTSDRWRNLGWLCLPIGAIIALELVNPALWWMHSFHHLWAGDFGSLLK